MTKRIILWLLLGLNLSVSGQEQLPVHFEVSSDGRSYYVSSSSLDTIKADFNFQPRTRGDSLVRPIMKEIKTLLDNMCPGRNDSLSFSIFITYDRNGEVRKIAYLIEPDDIDCFNEAIYVGIYNAFVNISRTLPMADLINAYYGRLMQKERKTGNSSLMFKYNSKTPSRYW